MRVALVCPYSWSRPGGVQSHVAGLAEALRSRGHEVAVLAPADGRVDGVVPLGRSFPIHDNGSVQRVALGPGAVRRTLAALPPGRFDVVHLHEPMLPATCLTVLVRRPAPLVGTFHMVARGPKWYRVFKPVCGPALARLAARIAVSPAARDYVARVFPGAYEVIPNGIRFPSQVPAGDRERRIVFVGRAEPRKGLEVLLAAHRRLGGEVPLDLVGPEGSFGPGVVAHGRVDDRCRDELLARAAVLCAPSLRSESFGLVLVEALAAGLPVVASDLPAYRRLLDPAAGLLVPPGDAEALTAALRRVLDDGALARRLAAAGREAAAPYDWSRVAPRIERVYREVIAA